MKEHILQQNPSTWLLLLYALPARQNTERVNLWRRFKRFGAVALKTSGYVLPDNPAQFERLQWLSKQVQDAGGETALIRVAEIVGMSNKEVVSLFNEARAAEYKELAATCQEALDRYTKSGDAELSAVLQRQQRRFREIREIDYFNSPGVHDAQVALQQVEKVLVPQKGANATRKLDPSEFTGKTWLTRPSPGIDRAGSAWLIRRFIDAKAKFVFDMDLAKHPKAIPFDMADVEFSHHADECTFETLVKRFGIGDKAVLRIAEMVHDADLEDQKFGRYECIGINCVLTGWARTGMRDEELLAKGTGCFEGLYQGLRK
jgi:hypothetical protein